MTQESHEIATKNETFKNKNEEENFQLILTAKSNSPERSANQDMDNLKEKNTSINNSEEEKVEMILSIQKKGYMFDKENLISSQALNLLFASFLDFNK